MLVSRLCIALVLACAGCSYPSGGEASASDCTDGMDNDGDELHDCNDPDCHAFDHCGARIGSPPAGAGSPAMPDDANTGTPPDAGVIIGDAATDTDAAFDEDDGGTIEPPEPADAGLPPCGGTCSATQACIDDVCEDVSSPTAGTFDLRILSAPVPSFNRWGMCLDACGSRFATFAFCACDPDPYVQVSRVRQDGQEQMRTPLGATPVRSDEVRPTYEDTLIRVELMEGDALLFVVLDKDPGTDDDTVIYACLPDLRALAPGPIQCSDTVVPFFPAYTIRAELLPVQ